MKTPLFEVLFTKLSRDQKAQLDHIMYASNYSMYLIQAKD